MLLDYYSNNMEIDTHRFYKVCADDPSITGEEYVDIPVDALPELKGRDFWWHELPPSGELTALECEIFIV